MILYEYNVNKITETFAKTRTMYTFFFKISVSFSLKWLVSFWRTLTYFLFVGVWWDWVRLVRRPLLGLSYQHRMMMMSVMQLVEWEVAGKPKYSEKTFYSATLSITNPTWPDLGSNLGHRTGKPATNHLSYDTASRWSITRKCVNRRPSSLFIK
jgi:hypothetical protein